MEFFRFCPECNRRFHIKLENKKRVNLERETVRTTRVARMGASNMPAGRSGYSAGPSQQMTMVYEGEPIIIDIEEFQYNYKCKHCGHEWSEKPIEKHRES
jgi:DNA-directed RNA polymerase subunit M/transcription elongation factor TFIIS